MGLIRGGLLFVVSFLLFLSLLAGNIFLVLSMSLEYDVVQPKLSSAIKEFSFERMDISSIIAEKQYPLMEFYCKNNSEQEFVFNEEGYTLVVPCSVVFEGPEAVTERVIMDFTEDIYYEDYNCNFWDCFEKTNIPFFLVSEKSKEYSKNKFYLISLISFILVVISFVLIDKKTSLFIILGVLLIISSLPLIKLEKIMSLFSDEYISVFLTIFFSKSHTVFIISVAVGLILVIFGILMKFFMIGYKISDIFSKKEKKISKKEVKDIVKEEISNSKKISFEKEKEKK